MAVAAALPRAGETVRPMTAGEKKVILASSLGTVFEWYDFFLYGSLATVIGAQFFSAYPEATRNIFALLAFAAGFIVRPFGALVFGRLGDLVGRKHTFLVTILIMGISTFAVGLLSAVTMVVLSKAVWVTTFGHPAALFPYDNPALFSMPLAFATIWVVSMMDKSRRAQRERAAFEAQYVRSETGIGASGAHAH